MGSLQARPLVAAVVAGMQASCFQAAGVHAHTKFAPAPEFAYLQSGIFIGLAYRTVLWLGFQLVDERLLQLECPQAT